MLADLHLGSPIQERMKGVKDANMHQMGDIVQKIKKATTSHERKAGAELAENLLEKVIATHEIEVHNLE